MTFLEALNKAKVDEETVGQTMNVDYPRNTENPR